MNWKLLNRVWHANLGMAAAITLGIIGISCPFIAHKGGEVAIGKMLMDIHYGKFLPADTRWIWIDSQGLFLLFLVGSGLLMHRKAVKKAANMAADDPAVPGSSVTLLDFGDRGLALAAEGEKRGLRVFRCPAANLSKLDLAQERWLVVLAGAEGFQTDQVEAVQALCAKVKTGSARRLSFALGGETGSEAVAAALVATGAKAMPLASGAFDTVVLDYLATQSASLSANIKPQTKRPASSVPAASTAAGFTLLEMLLSLIIVGLLVGGAAGALEKMAGQDRVRDAAKSFQDMLSEARDIAKREGTWVRVALLPQGKEQSLLRRGDPAQPRMGAAIYVLRRPALSVQGISTAAPTSDWEADGLQELVTVEQTTLPTSLQAGWEPAPGYSNWTLWDASVKVAGQIFNDQGADSPWKLQADAQHLDFPATLSETPVESAVVLAAEAFPSSDPSSEVFGTAPIKRWVASGRAALVAQLPSIDFSPNGSVVGTRAGAETIRFIFRHTEERPNSTHQVLLHTATGDAALQ
jgi:prepilin-type N-terminal cleavage/methylation domain-containing protein